jgi:oleandomycin transport system ATP-binding protein
MWEVVRSLVGDGATVLLTTQYLEEADALADEISVIDSGRVIAHDTPDGLKRVAGGRTLLVRPTDLDRLEDTVRLLGELSGHRPEASTRGSQATVCVPVDDEGVLTAAVARLATEGIAVTELSLHLPSLDEVFFTLTGRSGSAATNVDPDGGAESRKDAA